ncbi:MAG: adenylyltransferase/cytidyltransferase family protein [Microgenomates group bacterium]|jgi:D-beta-D-heptose 7-phosphate kinase/D-beta-D-heptose 1-phosphate adenosyltransferase
MKTSDEKVVLVGGCFDILHVGHIRFLQKARSLGDKLIVLLESDERIEEMKGQGRPVNIQKDRAEVLTSLEDVDVVVLLPTEMKNSDYDLMVKQINPDIIATTAGDPNIKFKERTAKLVSAKVKVVTLLVDGFSTQKIIEKIKKLS